METLNVELDLLVKIATVLLSFLTVIVSFYALLKGKKADDNLVKLIEKERANSTDTIEEYLKISKEVEELQAKIEHLISIHNNDIFTDAQKKILEEQIQLLRVQSLRKKVIELSKNLSKSERAEILEAVNQKSELGRANYLNRILESSTNIHFSH